MFCRVAARNRTIVLECVAPAKTTAADRVGMPVPLTAQLYSIPAALAVEVPANKTYKYMMVNGRMVLVDPATGDVAAKAAG